MEIKKFVDFILIIQKNNIKEIAVDIDGVFIDTNAAVLSCNMDNKIDPYARIGKIENVEEKDLDLLLNYVSWDEFVNLRLYLYLLTIIEDYPEIKIKFITGRYDKYGENAKEKIKTLFPTTDIEVITNASIEDKQKIANDTTLIIDDNVDVIEKIKNKITVKTPWTDEFINKTNCPYFDFWKLDKKISITNDIKN